MTPSMEVLQEKFGDKLEFYVDFIEVKEHINTRGH